MKAQPTGSTAPGPYAHAMLTFDAVGDLVSFSVIAHDSQEEATVRRGLRKALKSSWRRRLTTLCGVGRP